MATVSKSTRSTKITLASASAGPFDLNFRLFDTDAITVFVNGIEIPDTDWTLSTSFSNGYDDNATVTFDAALEVADVIIIDSDLAPARGDDYNDGPGLTALLNNELARIWSALSDVKRDTKRSFRAFDTVSPLALQAGKTLVVNDAADGFDVGPDASDIASAQTYAAQAEAWAVTAEDTEVETGKYSALHYAAKAGASAAAAGSSETKAGLWAEEDEDTEVEPGQYSAKHWAAKASAISDGSAYMEKASNLSDVADAATALSNLGLSATASEIDAVAGSIVEFIGDIDDLAQLPNGFYQVQAAATGSKPAASFNMISLRRGSAPHGNGTQMAFLTGTVTQYIRTWNGSVWSAWAQVYNGNTLPDLLKDIRDISFTEGDTLYYDGSNLVNLGIGTAGQILQVNSGATAPEWVDATNGGMTELGTQATTSGGTVAMSGLTLTNYKFLRVTFNKVKVGTVINNGSHRLDFNGLTILPSLTFNTRFSGTVDIDLANGIQTSHIMSQSDGSHFNAGDSGVTTASTEVELERVQIGAATGSFSAGEYTVYGVM